jgi:hypothetical protein
MTTPSFSGVVDALEIARGHDGLLRGHPDPVLIVGAYWHDGTMARTFGRTLHKFVVTKSAPCRALTDVRLLPSCALPRGASGTYVVLVLAVEENDGQGVGELFAAVERPNLLQVSSLERTDIDTFNLAAIPRIRDWSVPVAVHLLAGGAPASSLCKSDTLIGACAFWMPARLPAQPASYRVPFRSEDRKNDWTALLTIAS